MLSKISEYAKSFDIGWLIVKKYEIEDKFSNSIIKGFWWQTNVQQ